MPFNLGPWKALSSSNRDIEYTTSLSPEGLFQCTCPGWTNKKMNQARICKHIRQRAKENGLTIEGRGDHTFVASSEPVQQGLGAEVESIPDAGLPQPMLASALGEDRTAQQLIATGDFWMEEKLDGHRCLVVKRGEEITAWSRPRAGAPPNARGLSAPIMKALRTVPDGIYDGEVTVPGGTSSDVTALAFSDKLVLVLFDVLEADGTLTHDYDYEVRRAGLEAVIPTDGPVRLIASVEASMAALEAIWAKGGEGAILKRKGCRYDVGRRSSDWIKLVRQGTATLEIIGFVHGKGAGSGPYSVVKLRDPISKVETTVKTLDADMYRRFEANPKGHIGMLMVITFREKLKSGKWRHPMADHILETVKR